MIANKMQSVQPAELSQKTHYEQGQADINNRKNKPSGYSSALTRN